MHGKIDVTALLLDAFDVTALPTFIFCLVLFMFYTCLVPLTGFCDPVRQRVRGTRKLTLIQSSLMYLVLSNSQTHGFSYSYIFPSIFSPFKCLLNRRSGQRHVRIDVTTLLLDVTTLLTLIPFFSLIFS